MLLAHPRQFTSNCGGKLEWQRKPEQSILLTIAAGKGTAYDRQPWLCGLSLSYFYGAAAGIPARQGNGSKGALACALNLAAYTLIYSCVLLSCLIVTAETAYP